MSKWIYNRYDKSNFKGIQSISNNCVAQHAA